MKPSKWTNKKSELEQQRSTGKSLKEIGEQYGVTTQRMHQICSRLAVPKRELTNDEKQQLKALYKDGLTAIEIAPIIGLSHTTVLDILKTEKVQPRKPGPRPVKLKAKAQKIIEELEEAVG